MSFILYARNPPINSVDFLQRVLSRGAIVGIIDQNKPVIFDNQLIKNIYVQFPTFSIRFY